MNIIDQKTISQIAKRLRFQAGYSQEMVAYLLSMHRSPYSYKEQGVTAFNTDDLQRLAVLYQVPIDIFFTPELSEGDTAGERIKRKPARDVKNLAALSKKERELIGLIRFFQSRSEGEELTKRLQELVRQEMEKET